MIVELCIASASGLFFEERRDEIVAREILKLSNKVEILTVDVNQPFGPGQSCGMVYDFLDRWLVPGLRNQGVGIQQFKHGKCAPSVCDCPGKLVCAKEKTEVK